MSTRYTRREFDDADLTPGDCDRQVSGERGDQTIFMACDYHEGYIDGYGRGARDNM